MKGKESKKKPFNIWLVAGWAIVIVFVFVGYLNPHYFYSPGNLSQAHVESSKCKDCHNPFRGIENIKCLNCHGEEDMAAKSTSGILDYHRKVKTKDCSSCHPEHLGIQGKITEKIEHKGFNGNECIECHDLPEDRLHRDIFIDPEQANKSFKEDMSFFVSKEKTLGKDCGTCHNSADWKEATIDMERHAFPVNHEGAKECKDCHPETLKEYSCYVCHEHSPSKIRGEHLEEGIRNYDNCVKCHPTGLEHEGERDDDKGWWRRLRGDGDDNNNKRYRRDDDD